MVEIEHPDLKGKVALVTGSTSGGMGRSTAFTLAKHGAAIVLNYGTNRSDTVADKEAEAVRATIESMGRQVLLIKADTRKPAEVSMMVKKVMERFGRIDILVNNAGGGWNPESLTDTPFEQLQNVIEAEVYGALNCIRECLPVMRANDWGRIVNLGVFGAGHWAAENFGPIEYALGKGARALLTRHLALKERKYNITVNLINPGPGHTAHFESIQEAVSAMEHSQLWGKRKQATPQDIAEAVLFLCSEQARFITGSHIAFSIE